MSIFLARTLILLAATIACTPVWSQAEGPEPAPAAGSHTRKLLSQLPPGVKPVPGRGECFLLKAAAGPAQVVRLHCALDPYSMVMLPTGELEIVPRAKLQAATSPFVAATEEEMKASLKAANLSKFKVQKSLFYLYVYDCSEGFYMHTRSIMESMLSGVVENLKTLGLKVKRPLVPMVVVIMPSREAYEAYHAVPKEMTAYYNIMSNHIVMYEDQELWEAAPEYAAKKAGYVVSHEGTHQILANIDIHRRLSNWAPWIREGIAEYYSPLKVNSSLIRKGNSELPERTMKWTKAGMVNDLRMYSLLKMNASGNLIKNLVEAEEIDSNGYALAWGLVHFLANKKPDAFRAYLADVSQYEPLDLATEKRAGKPESLFVKHFGEDFDKIERELQAYLTSKAMQASYIDPVENQTHYVVKCVQKVGKAFSISLVITTSPAAAKKFKEEKEATNKKASFFTVVCKSRTEAERQLQKLNR